MKGRIVPVKLIAGLLFVRDESLKSALTLLNDHFKEADYISAPYPFTVSDYYCREMGEGLKRLLLSFEELVDPQILIRAKYISHAIEVKLSKGEGNRTVNIDMGYLDLHKLVLSSFKERGNKIYLGEGVWADLTLMYQGGRFEPFPWTFPDFKEGTYSRDLLSIRKLYKTALKSRGQEEVFDP